MDNRILGKYEIHERIADGSIGSIFKGKDTKKGSLVAIKIVHEEHSNNRVFSANLRKAVVQAMQLEHPNLIKFYDVGEYKNRLCYVMEYVEGTSIIKQTLYRGRLTECWSLDIVTQIATALEYANSHGIIHQNLTPNHIILNARVKIGDLGLPIPEKADTTAIAPYLSPEQQKKEDLDTRSDVYSLGALWYYMLTNSIPFEKLNLQKLMDGSLEQSLETLQRYHPQIFWPSCEVIFKMTHKEREYRYQNFTQVLEDIEKVKRGPFNLPNKIPIKKFRHCFCPSEIDVRFGKIAIEKGWITQEEIEECLNYQEKYALAGAIVNLGQIMLDQEKITPQQKISLDKIEMEQLLDQIDAGFLEEANAHHLYPKDKIQELKKWQKQGVRGVAIGLSDQQPTDDKMRETILATVKHKMSIKKAKLMLETAVEGELLTQTRFDKTIRIYQAHRCFGRFVSVEEIILERGFMDKTVMAALKRAMARSELTGKPALNYLQER
ncbi:serine/threonine protein kinase [Candidatus Uabimicrobium amorphum]|uniref:Putative serine/threonine-protein kinase n=1 Tax=Uabimicrobium amorphum TaxID=2596890 RepID=A0A5S9F2Y9_UABAM|nr:serine/threonine-protein kinase [Candidatus Uabimicrobium amorphum]BBM82864.1 putative serine/threonine-protein kinase [Candidatus Uabimicrobium amorphum]